MKREAQFLLDRLDEYDPEDEDHVRDWHGHVTPAIARLRSALADKPNPAQRKQTSRITMMKPPESAIDVKMYEFGRMYEEALEAKAAWLLGDARDFQRHRTRNAEARDRITCWVRSLLEKVAE